jgi:hypothetical protein
MEQTYIYLSNNRFLHKAPQNFIFNSSKNTLTRLLKATGSLLKVTIKNKFVW